MTYRLKSVIFLFALIPAAAFAEEIDDKSIQEALAEDSASSQKQNDKKLEKGGKKQLEQGSFLQKMNPDIGFVLDVGLGWHSADERAEQGGHAIDRNGFTIQGLEFAASANVDPFFRFEMNFELSHLHLHEIFVQTLSLPLNLQLKAGYLIADFGRENRKHLHVWSFVNPPLAHTRFLSEEHFGGTGAEISYLAHLPWYLLLSVSALDTGTNTQFSSSTFASVDKTDAGKTDGAEDFVYVARAANFFELSEDFSLSLGASGAWGQSPYVPDNRATLYGADLYFKYRPLGGGNDDFFCAFTAEYFLRDVQIPKDFARDHGLYAQLDFQFDREWQSALRFDYVAKISGDPPDDSISKKKMRAAASVSYAPSHFSKVRIQYEFNKDDRFASYDHAVYLQLEVSAGAHGAHSY